MANKNAKKSITDRIFRASGYAGLAGSILAVGAAAFGAIATTAVAPFLVVSFAALAVSGLGQLQSN